ncbi:hydrogen gas-evolving membrane-bound hydrogenase subunit E [Saliphagus sp. GCM10025334]
MSPDLPVVLAAVFLPFLAAGFAPLFVRFLEERTGYVGALVALCSFGLLATQYETATTDPGTVELAWIPTLDIALRFTVDGWGLLFALLASGIGVLVFSYSPAYVSGADGLSRYYGALLAFMGSIIGVALAADLIAIFVFWELTSVWSFLLIGYYTSDPGSTRAARMAMIVTAGGGLFLLVGLLILSLVAGDVIGSTAAFDLAVMLENPDAMEAGLRERGLFLPALGLIAVGAASKSAQVPLHFWLPNAMAAPTPVSAFLHSATMVKVGVYFVGRVRPIFVGSEWLLLFVTLGLTTMVVCAVLALASTDIKELLAYSTASHLGLMIAGFGVPSYLGAETGVFHLLNHALFKAALFLIAGIVAHQMGTRRLSELGGLRHHLPITAGMTTIVALSMAGIPPFNGFYSKELLFEAVLEVGTSHDVGALEWIYPAVAVFGSVITVLYSLRFLSIFFGDRVSTPEHAGRPAIPLLASPAVLTLLAVVVSVDPDLAVRAIVQAGFDATATDPHEMHVGLPTSLSLPVGMSAVTIALGVGLFPFVDRFQRGASGLVGRTRAINPSRWYDGTVDGLEVLADRLDATVHDGLLRTYATWTLLGICALVLGGFVATGAITPFELGTDVRLEVALILLVAVLASVALAVASSHVSGVLTLSILGFMLAIFYILASAPDLALTQLVVETLVLVLFLLVIEEVPQYVETGRSLMGEIRDVGLSMLVGVTAFVTVVVTTGARPDGTSDVARQYIGWAVPEGGGTNIVNVTLVDFRGFDTLGELVVVALAAISISTLITMRSNTERTGDRAKRARLEADDYPDDVDVLERGLGGDAQGFYMTTGESDMDGETDADEETGDTETDADTETADTGTGTDTDAETDESETDRDIDDSRGADR